MKKATRFEKQGSQSQADSTTKPKTKIARVLEHIIFNGSLNTFEAERIGDHALPSTISSLANGYGLLIKRTPERVPTNWGAPCDVIRYSIPACAQQRALNLLAYLCKPSRERGEVPNE